MMPAKIFAFEGCDRSGKSSQCEAVYRYLMNTRKDLKVYKYQYPDRSNTTGKLLDNYLNKKVDFGGSKETVHLLFSANRWENQEALNDIMGSEDHAVILMDRYVASGLAFSLAKGLDRSWCMASDKGLLKPSRTFFFDISPKEAASRAGYGEERYESLAFQQKVYDAYRSIEEHASWTIIDATMPMDLITQDLISKIEEDLFRLK